MDGYEQPHQEEHIYEEQSYIDVPLPQSGIVKKSTITNSTDRRKLKIDWKDMLILLLCANSIVLSYLVYSNEDITDRFKKGRNNFKLDLIEIKKNQDLLKEDGYNLTAFFMEMKIKQDLLTMDLEDFENKITAIKTQQELSDVKVALTACTPTDINVKAGEIVKFTSVKTGYGIPNPNMIISTGTFTCEKPGLYILSVFIMSYSPNAIYMLYRNSERITYVQVVPGSTRVDYHTGSGTIVLQLDVADTLYVKAYSTIHVEGSYSCFSVIKI